jgi:anaerobic selenocysteine-containing dehydrogenase
MDIQLLRRDFFKFAGGSAAGLLLTPVPWRLITDTALWSQNWKWIPRAPRGEIHTRFTHCALCPAGCAVKARCVGEQPVSLAGVGVGGALCPFGLTAHHLPYHPARLKMALRHGDPVPIADAVRAIGEAVAKRAAGEYVAVLELRPGRTASWMFRRALAAVPDTVYLVPSALPETGVDFERVKTIVSFGFPVLDGWGTPGRVVARRDRFQLIQVEPVASRSAMLADLWLPAKPGSENALALGLRHLVAEGSAAEYTPPVVSALTGLEPAQIEAAAKMLAGNRGRALALGPGKAIADLNAAFEAPLVPLREPAVPKEWQPSPAVTPLAAAADRSIRVLFIDESLPGALIPWSAIERKLVRDNPLVISFACSRQGYARYAQFVLPVPVPSEVPHDLTGAGDSPASSFRIAVPLTAPPAGLVEPASIVAAACGAILPEKPLEQRAAAIHRAGRGSIVGYADEKSTPVKEIGFEGFWKTLNEGGRWEDEVEAATGVHLQRADDGEPPPQVEAGDLPLAVVLSAQIRPTATPLMTKLYQESGLRQAANQVVMNPLTGSQCGVEDGDRALLQTRCGKCEVRVILDSGAMPGVVQVEPSPGLVDICTGPSARGMVVRL